ncbi:MAG: 3-phenylpropionate dioxygenase [Chloroflexi bacterium]|nr:3-phenylpropionate dioxygenase [Chloroflexota bacterium]
MNDDVRVAVEQTLYREARLIDERRFHEWLQMFTEDVRYRMPLRTVHYAAGSKAVNAGLDNPPPQLPDATAEDEIAVFDENFEFLSKRVARLETGSAWAEDPPSRTVHLVTAVEVEPRSDGEVTAYSAVLVHRVRLEADEDTVIARREDVLRNVEGAWKIARRTILIDQAVLTTRSMSFFI